MKANELQYFVGKVCTVLTQPINRNFKEENPQSYPEPIFVYFVGIVEFISEQGLLLQQVANNETKKPLKTYFFLDKIVAIAEEESLDYNDPKEAQIIQKIKEQQIAEEKKFEKTSQTIINQPANAQYIDPDALTEMAERFKQNFSGDK